MSFPGISGAGGQPAGSTLAGGALPAAPAPTQYVVYPDPQSGLSDSGRRIDPATGRFALSPSGNPVGIRTIPQIVQIAWTTLDYSSIGPLDAGASTRAYQAYLAAVSSLSGQMVILTFDARHIPGTSALWISIRWRDLTDGVEYTYQTGAPQT